MSIFSELRGDHYIAVLSHSLPAGARHACQLSIVLLHILDIRTLSLKWIYTCM